jgi:gluconokinase
VGDGAAANRLRLRGRDSHGADRRHIRPSCHHNRRTTDSIPSGLWSYRVDAGHHLVGGALTEGGNVYQWATATLRLEENLEAALLQREPDQHGLTVLPLLAGERSPGWATHATGAILGLRLSTSPLDILQAILESVALRLAQIAGQLAPVLKREAGVVGGGRARRLRRCGRR